MKRSIQTVNEIGIAGCIITAAVVAIILMVGHAVWTEVTSTPSHSSQGDGSLEVADISHPRILLRDSSSERPGKLRKKLGLKERPVVRKAWEFLPHLFAARQRMDRIESKN